MAELKDYNHQSWRSARN